MLGTGPVCVIATRLPSGDDEGGVPPENPLAVKAVVRTPPAAGIENTVRVRAPLAGPSSSSCAPSGVQERLAIFLVVGVSCTTWVPSAAITMAAPPSTHAMWLPSGDHVT